MPSPPSKSFVPIPAKATPPSASIILPNRRPNCAPSQNPVQLVPNTQTLSVRIVSQNGASVKDSATPTSRASKLVATASAKMVLAVFKRHRAEASSSSFFPKAPHTMRTPINTSTANAIQWSKRSIHRPSCSPQNHPAANITKCAAAKAALTPHTVRARRRQCSAQPAAIVTAKLSIDKLNATNRPDNISIYIIITFFIR